MANFRGSSRFPSGSRAVARVRRASTWFQFQPVTTTLVATGGTIIFSLNAEALALRPFTIVRTRFLLHVRSDQSGAIENQAGALGLAVVSDEATAVGVTAVPTPISELGSDLWFAVMLYMAAGSAVNEGRVGSGFELDSRAMRKVEVGQDIVVVLEQATPSSGQIVVTGGRMLVKLH